VLRLAAGVLSLMRCWPPPVSIRFGGSHRCRSGVQIRERAISAIGTNQEVETLLTDGVTRDRLKRWCGASGAAD
jgi:hypothetical protein